MSSGYYVYRLMPPRPTFNADMSEEERAIMGRHGEYWRGLSAEGRVLVFGPVSDDTGAWGRAVLRAGSDAEAREMADGDPAISSGMARAEQGPMLAAVLEPGR